MHNANYQLPNGVSPCVRFYWKCIDENERAMKRDESIFSLMFGCPEIEMKVFKNIYFSRKIDIYQILIHS